MNGLIDLLKKNCTSTTEQMNKEFTIISKSLLSITEVHIPIYSGGNYIEGSFFSCPKLPCMKTIEKSEIALKYELISWLFIFGHVQKKKVALRDIAEIKKSQILVLFENEASEKLLLEEYLFTEWREPEEEWFWWFEPFSKLKIAFCEY